MDGTCKVCGREIYWWGKERLYCSDACKQKMCRERREQEKQAQREVELIQLRARWKRLGLCPDVMNVLEGVLEEDDHSLRIVQMATKAIEMHLQPGKR